MSWFKAAECGKLEVLQWLLENHSEHCPLDVEIFYAGIRSGCLDVVCWLNGIITLEHSFEEASNIAAEYGKFEILQYIRIIDHTWSTNLCTKSAALGSIRQLEWAKREDNQSR